MADKLASPLRETDAGAIRLARTLVRTARSGALATLEPTTGMPLASRVGVATDADGAPLVLISLLAAHTGALLADPRCSILLGEPGKGDPLAHPRITLFCRARRLDAGTVEEARARRRYLNRNPKAELYAALPDFYLFRLDPDRASLNGGFGKAYQLSQDDILLPYGPLAELAAIEQSAVDHMNADHADAIDACARHYAGARTTGWRLCGIDPDGLDLQRGSDGLRVPFPRPLSGADELRPMLVEMAKAARAADRPQS